MINCPFCDAKIDWRKNACTFNEYDPSKKTAYLYKYLCRNCKAEGPHAPTLELAAELWDKRI